MGQLLNRFKRLVRSSVGAAIDSAAKTVGGVIQKNDFLREKWEASNKFRAGVGDKFEEGQEYVKEAWEDLTTDVPYSLKKSYDAIEVPFGLPLEDVEKAWKKLLWKHHPDKVTGDKEREAATKKVAKINEAYQKIKDYFAKIKK